MQCWICSSAGLGVQLSALRCFKTTDLCQASWTLHHTGAEHQSRKLNRLKTQAEINLSLISLQERLSCELSVLCRAMHVVTVYYILQGSSDWMQGNCRLDGPHSGAVKDLLRFSRCE